MAGEMLTKLQTVIQDRLMNPKEGSYTNQLLDSGIERIAQKVGEEAVETVIAALAQDEATLANEAADLMYHLTVLLVKRGLTWADIEQILSERHR